MILLRLRSLLLLTFFIFFYNDSRAQSSEKQFSYAHETEIAYNGQPGVKLNPQIDTLAYTLNKHLNQSIFFDPTFLKDPQTVREYHLRSKPANELTGQTFTVKTDDGVTLGATYFNRGSDTLLVVGTGFTNERELMSPFVAMFPDFDVVIFDFRGHGYTPSSFFSPSTWQLNPIKAAFGVDCSLVHFGHDEDKDVFAVVDGFKGLKRFNTGQPYKHVLGLGLCYGAFILLKTAAVYPGIFDKLVLDGCWLSLSRYIEKVTNDFKTMCNPQTGGWSDHWFLSNPWVKKTIQSLATNFLLNLDEISMLDYAPTVKKTELLLFYGKDDYMVNRDEFEQLWGALSGINKTAIITSNHHVRNHLKQKELYKFICDLFFTLPQDQLISCLQDPDKAVTFFTRNLRF